MQGIRGTFLLLKKLFIVKKKKKKKKKKENSFRLLKCFFTIRKLFTEGFLGETKKYSSEVPCRTFRVNAK